MFTSKKINPSHPAADEYPELMLPADIPAEVWAETERADLAPDFDPSIYDLPRVILRVASEYIAATEYGGVPIPEFPLRPYGAPYAQEEADALAERRAKAEALAKEIQATPIRRYAAVGHVVRIEQARALRDAREEAVRSAAAMRAMHECPVCLSLDHESHGRVDFRALLAGQSIYEGVATIRSCLACWNVASAQHAARLATEIVADGTESRQAAVARFVA